MKKENESAPMSIKEKLLESGRLLRIRAYHEYNERTCERIQDRSQAQDQTFTDSDSEFEYKTLMEHFTTGIFGVIRSSYEATAHGKVFHFRTGFEIASLTVHITDVPDNLRKKDSIDKLHLALKSEEKQVLNTVRFYLRQTQLWNKFLDDLSLTDHLEVYEEYNYRNILDRIRYRNPVTKMDYAIPCYSSQGLSFKGTIEKAKKHNCVFLHNWYLDSLAPGIVKPKEELNESSQ